MKVENLYQGKKHRWVLIGRDDGKPEGIIDTNQYLVHTGEEAILLDPGGIELFAPMLASLLPLLELDQITTLFASHQDPDIISSLGLWDKTVPHAKLYAPWIWEGFIRHFGMDNIQFMPIKDEGGSLTVNGCVFRFIPAHYLHSSGNFHFYDEEARILMSGDIGAALEPTSAPLFVDDFASHIDKMKYFHQRWMPSNRAKSNWVARVRELDIDIMAPQHGRVFKGEMVDEFLEWFARLEVGVA